ncbi:MAG: hypothetical protein CUN50_05025 [Candidatus Thermofonsia Clade 1 bacterium]|uniref:Uncharacterized protein n=1 Tax=Candidatus Thermofonsia Clade 1 bacterium TaxID=2364210 RepID=A0A2M8PXG2_9CHLR|nr:MAG: hypothetical protein CUN50_05025 [Candidatus Thermofonsia Clade 1 bacterium]
MSEQSLPSAPAEPMRRSLLPLKALFVSLGVIFAIVVIAILATNAQRAARSTPIEIEMFPNLRLVGESRSENSDMRYFTSDAPIDEVYNFYATRLGTLAFRSGGELGEDVSRGCRKIYQDEPPREEPGRYFARCFVDNSQSDMTHRLLLTIVYDLEARQTRLEMRRDWSN